MLSLTTVALLATLTSAAPTLIPRGEGTTFNFLVSLNGTTAPEPIAALNQGIWALTSNSDNHATLVSDRSQAALFYEYTNHTSQGEGRGVATGNFGVVVTPGGTATVPSSNTVDLVQQASTMDARVNDNSGEVPTLEYENGKFAACLASSLDSNAKNPDDIILNYVADGQRYIVGCAPVVLISVCAGGGSGSDDVGALGTPMAEFCQSN